MFAYPDAVKRDAGQPRLPEFVVPSHEKWHRQKSKADVVWLRQSCKKVPEQRHLRFSAFSEPIGAAGGTITQRDDVRKLLVEEVIRNHNIPSRVTEMRVLSWTRDQEKFWATEEQSPTSGKCWQNVTCDRLWRWKRAQFSQRLTQKFKDFRMPDLF